MNFLRRAGLLLLLVSFVTTSGISLQPVSPTERELSSPTQYSIDDKSIAALQSFFQSTLTKTEKQFPGQRGLLKGFGAGTTYPQVWLRDSATAIPVTRYYYPAEYLTSWIEEHLAHQNRDGSLYDWIAGSPKSNFLTGAPRARDVYRSGSSGVAVSADKNTTEADQETSAVDAAYQVFQITDDRKWLTKNIAGQSLIRRLDLSLAYLLKARFDQRHGLIKNAFTADWGDVGPVYDDQRAIYLDAETPLVAGLYTNVLFYRAAGQIGELYRALGLSSRSIYWTKIAISIKENINRYLWQEDRGFYRMHIELEGKGNPQFDDSNMFAMGSNGLAVLYDVANETQALRIFDVASERQREFGVSTIAGVLLPPYPAGVFRHPAVGEQYFYQNGGQWDWFAGRFLLAEFERGDARRASTQLSAIAAKAEKNGGLFEWHTREGKGMGSPNYLGSAGALAAALFQGLFGVYSTANSLDLKIRLAKMSAQVNLYEPATKRMVFYDYRYFPDQARLVLTYQSNFHGSGRVCILLPEKARPGRLLKHGEPVEFTNETMGKDRYACFGSNWAYQRVELQISPAPQDRNSAAKSCRKLRRLGQPKTVLSSPFYPHSQPTLRQLTRCF
jgi:hypothetical protein